MCWNTAGETPASPSVVKKACGSRFRWSTNEEAPREDTGDVLQLCGQAMCLEAMLCCDIPEGALYYGEIRRRERVAFTPELRGQVRQMLAQMHDLYQRGYTPKVKPAKSCNACSMKEICLPKLMKNRSVAAYLKSAMEEAP